MKVDLLKFSEKSKERTEDSLHALSKINTSLSKFDIDELTKSKGFFNKKKYVNLYDVYLAYYRTSMDLLPLIDSVDEIEEQILEDIQTLDAIIQEYPERMDALNNELIEANKMLDELKNNPSESEEFDFSGDSREVTRLLERKFEEDRVSHTHLNVVTKQELLRQEQMQVLIMQQANMQLLKTIEKLVHVSIPIWKKQVKMSIDIITVSNKIALQKETHVTKDSEVAKELEKAKLAHKELQDELQENLKEVKLLDKE